MPESEGGDDPEPAAILEAMKPLEPYTAVELAEQLGTPRRAIRAVLDRLWRDGDIRRKEPEPDRRIWIKPLPAHDCPACGREFEVRFLHPVLASATYCPRCGERL